MATDLQQDCSLLQRRRVIVLSIALLASLAMLTANGTLAVLRMRNATWAQPLPFFVGFATINAAVAMFCGIALYRYRRTGKLAVRPQFSVQHLLVLTLLAGIWLASWNWQRREDRQRIAITQSLEQQLMAIIQEGQIQLDGRHDRLALSITRSTFSDIDLKQLIDAVQNQPAQLRYLSISALMFSKTNLSAQGMALLAQWNAPIELTFMSCSLNDEELTALSQSPTLHRLRLIHVVASDTALQRFKSKRPDVHIEYLPPPGAAPQQP